VPPTTHFQRARADDALHERIALPLAHGGDHLVLLHGGAGGLKRRRATLSPRRLEALHKLPYINLKGELARGKASVHTASHSGCFLRTLI
jgi:hypothetical protein